MEIFIQHIQIFEFNLDQNCIEHPSGLEFYCKGQSILKCPLGVFNSSKKNQSSKMRSNQKNRGTLYHYFGSLIRLFDLTLFYRIGQNYKNIFVCFLVFCFRDLLTFRLLHWGSCNRQVMGSQYAVKHWKQYFLKE